MPYMAHFACDLDEIGEPSVARSAVREPKKVQVYENGGESHIF